MNMSRRRRDGALGSFSPPVSGWHRPGALLRLAAAVLLPVIAQTPLGPDARGGEGGGAFVRLVPLPPPRIVAAAEEFHSERYQVAHLLDGKPQTEYASRGKGTATFVEFDFGRVVRIAGFRHQDRNDLATIAVSELRFLDAGGKSLAVVSVTHVNQRSGLTLFALPAPVAARRVRWQVTRLGSRATAVGGAEIGFLTVAERGEARPAGIGLDVHSVDVLRRQGGRLVQPLVVFLDYPYGAAIDAVVRVTGQEPRPLRLSFGQQRLDYVIGAVEVEQTVDVSVEVAGQTAVAHRAPLHPARKTTIYILPHSHNDIGYTALQTEIEDKQVNNLLLGMEYARRTAGYPPGARFVWNVEVLWGADLYLRRLAEPQRAAFCEAVKKGQVALCGMYLNELTGLCRPEELLRLFRCATQLGEKTGVPVDSAMISDVPGYTWGTVTAMSQAGIKYFSVAPNYLDRIGDILVQWENKPFYWVGPSGREKVLVWIPYKGYALSHLLRTLTPAFIEQFQTQLAAAGYPYDVAYIRWSGHGDNALPDPAICDFVKDWSAQYEWPKLVISSASTAFRALEERYGAKLPQVAGDWTPYWEDGAGSSALETGMNRASSDRLAQAEALWAMRSPRTYPAGDFARAWRHVLLYSEHTWGASCSVSEPLRRETREQWAVKQSYAVSADLESRDLLSRALACGQRAADESQLDVFNTHSWPRTGLVVVPKYLSGLRNLVRDDTGRPLASQRLRSGELAFVARDVPPLAARRYTLEEGPPHVEGKVKIDKLTLDNGLVRVRLDPHSGGIIELHAQGIDANLADPASGHAINDYLYLIGDDLAGLKTSGRATISVKENGPLVASLLVESDAPGCYKLRREVRLTAGLDYVEIDNLVDKQRLVAASYYAKEGKESVNFAFPFNLPEARTRLDVPFGVVRPNQDQIPSACKNWFTVSRWADMSNRLSGVTWVTLDAPLVELGAVTAALLNSQTDPAAWLKQVQPKSVLYSWAMNNHWHTNYRAYQEGPVPFRFVLRPHPPAADASCDAAATRLALDLGQPLLVAGARAAVAGRRPRLSLDGSGSLVAALKPSDDGRALIVRLWGTDGHAGPSRITWGSPAPRRIFFSDLSERPLQEAGPSIDVPLHGLVTLRAELE